MKIQLRFLEAIKYEGFYDNPDSPNYLRKEDFDILVKIDPSPTKKYAQWIIRQAVKEQRNPPVGLPNFLKKYDSLKEWKNFPVDKKNIMDFKTMKDFISFIQDSHQMIQQADYHKYKKESFILLETDEVLVLHPKTDGAAIFFGTYCDNDSPMWCTANPRQRSHYNSYSQEGDLFIIRYKSEEEGKLFKEEAYQLFVPDPSKSPSNYPVLEFNNQENDRMELDILNKFLMHYRNQGKISFLLAKLEPILLQNKFEHAISNRNKEEIQYCVDQGVDINFKEGFALIQSCLYRDEELAKYLLEHGANPNVKANYPIRVVCSRDLFDTFKEMMKHGAEINENIARWVYFCVENNSFQIARYILENQSLFPGSEVIHTEATISEFYEMALRKGNLDMATLLVKFGANPYRSTYKFVEFIDEASATQEDLAEAEKYLKSGVDVKYNDNYLIKTAFYTGNVPLAELLIKYGANAEEGWSHALYKQDTRMADVIIKAGVITKDEMGSALSYAIGKALYIMVEYLLKKGADPDWNHGVPLYTAVMSEDIKLFRLLLLYGASKDSEQMLKLLNKGNISSDFKELAHDAMERLLPKDQSHQN